MPDILSVFRDCSVAGEDAGMGDVDQAGFVPTCFVGVFCLHLGMSFAIGVEVLEHEVLVIGIEDGVVNIVKSAVSYERTAEQFIYDSAHMRVHIVFRPS